MKKLNINITKKFDSSINTFYHVGYYVKLSNSDIREIFFISLN